MPRSRPSAPANHPAIAQFRRAGIGEARRESSKLIEEASALGLTGAREQGMLLRFKLDPTADQVLADRVQIEQVLVNLFRNALEAMASRPIASSSSNAKSADDMIEIAVSDTGHDSPTIPMSTCFSRSSRPRTRAWVSAFRSAGRSLKPMAAGCGPRQMQPVARRRFTLPAGSAKDVTDGR